MNTMGNNMKKEVKLNKKRNDFCKTANKNNTKQWIGCCFFTCLLLVVFGLGYYAFFFGECKHPVDAFAALGCAILVPSAGILTSFPLFFVVMSMAPKYKNLMGLTAVLLNVILLMFLC